MQNATNRSYDTTNVESKNVGFPEEIRFVNYSDQVHALNVDMRATRLPCALRRFGISSFRQDDDNYTTSNKARIRDSIPDNSKQAMRNTAID
jgi:hypothetical protein